MRTEYGVRRTARNPEGRDSWAAAVRVLAFTPTAIGNRQSGMLWRSRPETKRVGKRSTHATLLDILAAHQPGPLLDIPCGAGPVHERASALGYHVVGVDLFPEEGFRGIVADACQTFPFASRQFAAVVCMEGIEHLENQTAFLRECARVLRPGGTLILTTPNILHLSSRLSGFLTGQRVLKQGFINEISTLRARMGENIYHGHAFLIDVFRLRYLMRVVGLELDTLYPTRLSPMSIGMSPLVPFIWLATRYALWGARQRRAKRKRPPVPQKVEEQLASLALSPALLFSRGLIIVGHKPAGEE